MSRIGKMPVIIPSEVKVALEGRLVEVEGPKGSLKREFSPEIDIALEGGALVVSRRSDSVIHRSLHGLTRALLNNMVIGVTKGFEKSLDVIGVGYRATKTGNKLTLNVGYSHPVEMDPGADLEIEVPSPNKIIIKGTDKEKVGAFAANVRKVRPPEPYKGKGIKYSNEVIKRKAGKTGSKNK
jgi:large subunit ribosomal protein L6